MVSLYPLFVEKIIPMALSVIGFGLLIVVHEFGHLLFCKIFNIYVPSFSIGFGPKIFEKKIGETTYRLAQIPFGGYVEIAGQEEIGQGDQLHAHDTSDRSYASKYYWQKVLVWLGGIIFNLLFAYVVFIGLFVFSSNTTNKISISNVGKDTPAAQAGLQRGDFILAIDNFSLDNSKEDSQKNLLEIIQNNPEKEITFSIERAGEQKNLLVKLGSLKREDSTIGFLGASFPPAIIKLPFPEAISAGIKTTNAWIFLIAKGLKDFFSKKSLAGAGGPVMIFAEGFKTAQHGLTALFIFLAIMSINLALFNLLPLGITDGGQLLFATLEFIIRRPLPTIVRTIINVISLVSLVALAAYLTYQDVTTIFGSFFKKLYARFLVFFS